MLNALYNFVARATVVIHGGLQHVTGDNGYTWALSIILLTAGVRLILVPLFVKQIKSQRTMQVMQPKIKELREKYKNDKQKLNEEMIKLQREHGNPLLGCLPTVLQIPLFLALYRVMNGFEPQKSLTIPGNINGYYPDHLSGLSVSEASQIAHAKIFGASLATTFRSSHEVLNTLGANIVATRIVCGVLIVVMMLSTYVTQRQIMGRNSVVGNPQQAATQKILLYVSPLFLGIFGLRISVGGLLYWFTSNVWSMVQQLVVIRRMPPVIEGGSGPAASTAGAPQPSGGGGLLGGRRREAPPPPAPAPARLVQQRTVSDSAPSEPTGSPRGGRPPRGGSAAKRKKGRKGGRR
ncbi:MAG TPA: membrane protein insertase YidC [Mycobacteriales bacterium]